MNATDASVWIEEHEAAYEARYLPWLDRALASVATYTRSDTEHDPEQGQCRVCGNKLSTHGRCSACVEIARLIHLRHTDNIKKLRRDAAARADFPDEIPAGWADED